MSKAIRSTLWFLGLGLYSFIAQAQDHTVNTFQAEAHSGGATIEQDFTFPADISAYDSISMTIALTCPAGGCDPWDRYGNIRIKAADGEEYEIGRYMTPYGNDWCDWTLDVSAYRSLLTGQVTLKSHIDTWQNGWALTLTFDFWDRPGVPTPHILVTNLQVDYHIIYGDTIFYSLDLDEVTYCLPNEFDQATVRIMNTGHGQGNTENAAEFSQKTHEVWINGQKEFDHYLWKADCDQNPCSPQGGTWQFARAGWCPGQEVPPTDFDVTSVLNKGAENTFDYVLEPFFNACSPWNPTCDDGVTCADCNYNSNSHTEPHYKFASQLILYSSQAFSGPLETACVTSIDARSKSASFQIEPNPSNGWVQIRLPATLQGNSQLSILNIEGKLVQQHAIIGKKQVTLNLADLPKGMYLIQLQNSSQTHYQKLILTD